MCVSEGGLTRRCYRRGHRSLQSTAQRRRSCMRLFRSLWTTCKRPLKWC